MSQIQSTSAFASRRIWRQLLISFSAGVFLALTAAAQEPADDSLVVRSVMFRQSSYSMTAASTSSFFYWHTFRRASESNERWIGIYGGRLRKEFDLNPEAKMHMNRFVGFTVARQVGFCVATPVMGVYIYNAWVNDDFFSRSQVILLLTAAMPTSVYIIMPYFKKHSLKKAAIAYNRGRMKR